MTPTLRYKGDAPTTLVGEVWNPGDERDVSDAVADHAKRLPGFTAKAEAKKEPAKAKGGKKG